MEILAAVLITLKMIGYINWSWWWVLAPIWVPVAVSLAVLGFWFVASIASVGLIQPPLHGRTFKMLLRPFGLFNRKSIQKEN